MASVSQRSTGVCAHQDTALDTTQTPPLTLPCEPAMHTTHPHPWLAALPHPKQFTILQKPGGKGGYGVIFSWTFIGHHLGGGEGRDNKLPVLLLLLHNIHHYYKNK